jgi:hypothetical protein
LIDLNNTMANFINLVKMGLPERLRRNELQQADPVGSRTFASLFFRLYCGLLAQKIGPHV